MSDTSVVNARSVDVNFQPDGKVVILIDPVGGDRIRLYLEPETADDLHALLTRGLSALRQNPAAP
jgi:pyridoxal/pyridoxine/pyridoxamine kinase